MLYPAMSPASSFVVVGTKDGASEGKADGVADGVLDGETDGVADGELDGETDGVTEGDTEGIALGLNEGFAEGEVEGEIEGKAVGAFDVVGPTGSSKCLPKTVISQSLKTSSVTPPPQTQQACAAVNPFVSLLACVTSS